MILANRFSYPPGFEEKCKAILDMALEHVPAYKGWKRFDKGPQAPTDERFDSLPVLTKADVRANFPLGLIPDWMDLDEGLWNEDISYTYTSGTTSEKVVNIWNQDWWDRSEAASWRLNSRMIDLEYPPKVAKLASSLNVGINCEEDLPMSHRILGNILYLNEKTSVLQWRPRLLLRMADELVEYRPDIIEANPTLLAKLLYWSLDNGVEMYSPKAIVFTFEFPSAIHLAAFRKSFSSALVSSYGTTETGFVMEQCECDRMHQNTEFCRIDFVPLKEKYGGPEIGRIYVTTFDNPWNCIIRFDVGDLIKLHPSGKCECGRSGGMIADSVEGRVSNVTFTTNGGLVTTKSLDDHIAEINAVRDYRLEQRDRTNYLLEAVLSQEADRKAATEEIRSVLKKVYGSDGKFEIKILEEIFPGPAGKYRRTQANFEFDENELFI